jgi:phosphatidylglycerophosphate synthase
VVAVGSAVRAYVAGLVLLLAVLAARFGLGAAGWVVGLGCAAVLATAVLRAAAREGVAVLGPADHVTLTRGSLACAVAALVAASAASTGSRQVLVGLAVVALVLDLVDGRVARGTGTATPFGGRLDGETDAFLMFVLSVDVARWAGAGALAIGGVRYAFWLAGRVWPWLQATVPPRYWRKVVCATGGIALVVAAAQVAPRGASYAGLVLATVLLAESFGRDVVWLWRKHRAAAPCGGERQVGRIRFPG